MFLSFSSLRDTGQGVNKDRNPLFMRVGGYTTVIIVQSLWFSPCAACSYSSIDSTLDIYVCYHRAVKVRRPFALLRKGPDSGLIRADFVSVGVVKKQKLNVIVFQHIQLLGLRSCNISGVLSFLKQVFGLSLSFIICKSLRLIASFANEKLITAVAYDQT